MNVSRTRFYLNPAEGEWRGVCAGVADYTGVDATWVRLGAVLLTLMGGFPWTLIGYGLTVWLATDRPARLYDSPAEEKFWQGVRANPSRSTRDIRTRFKDIDRRLADIELHYTSQNRRLADEIERLR